MDDTDPLLSPLIDVTEQTLAQLAESADTHLTKSIAAILAEINRQSQTISGWSSYIDKDGAQASE